MGPTRKPPLSATPAVVFYWIAVYVFLRTRACGHMIYYHDMETPYRYTFCLLAATAFTITGRSNSGIAIGP